MAPRIAKVPTLVLFTSLCSKAVIASGGMYKTGSEIWFLDEDTFQPGPDLPRSIAFGASVQLEKTFLVVGGHDYSSVDTLGDIYIFDNEGNEFVKLPQTLTHARERTAAFMVPNSYC